MAAVPLKRSLTQFVLKPTIFCYHRCPCCDLPQDYYRELLSPEPLWTSIRESVAHPLRPQLEVKLGEVFSNERIAHDWMRGLLSSQQIIAGMEISLDRRFRQDFLMRRLDIDCARMRVNVGLF